MFRLSTKVQYGLRFMLDLAFHNGDGPVPLKDIAKRERISEKYLGNLIVPLRTARLITSVRGSHGGYSLAKPGSQINLKDIICALEGPLSLIDCVDNPSVCRAAPICVHRDVWCELSESLQQSLEAVTLKNMLQRRRNKARGATTYGI